METPTTETVPVDHLVTFAEEFTGRQFYGKARTSQGTFVSARRIANGRKIEVTFEGKQHAFGTRHSVDYPAAATVTVSK